MPTAIIYQVDRTDPFDFMFSRAVLGSIGGFPEQVAGRLEEQARQMGATAVIRLVDAASPPRFRSKVFALALAAAREHQAAWFMCERAADLGDRGSEADYALQLIKSTGAEPVLLHDDYVPKPPTPAARLREYMEHGALEVPRLARILELPTDDVQGLLSGEADLMDGRSESLAARIGVAPRWLNGEQHYPEWSEEIQKMQALARSQILTLGATTIEGMLAQMVRLAGEHSALCRRRWFFSMVMGIPEDQILDVLANEKMRLPVIQSRLWAFFDLEQADV